jgi:hypothetical protein
MNLNIISKANKCSQLLQNWSKFVRYIESGEILQHSELNALDFFESLANLDKTWKFCVCEILHLENLETNVPLLLLLLLLLGKKTRKFG